MLGLTFDKLLLVGVIAAFLLGPRRLPGAAAALGRWVRRLRDLADDAKARVREEVGSEFDEIEWRRLDPRQYDPRRIIRDALLEPVSRETEPESSAAAGNVSALPQTTVAPSRLAHVSAPTIALGHFREE